MNCKPIPTEQVHQLSAINLTINKLKYLAGNHNSQLPSSQHPRQNQ
uniref:Uncharacterized protein n=1 Tax=Arundo donax TaxID=35708 RepID=A0A0A9GD40_ARUDO